MSRFINSAVNYSETNVLKMKHLSNILKLYNEYILLNNSKNIIDNVKYIIPNNNVKYYLLIMNKSDITPSTINNKYKICYFFTNHDSNIYTDFYVEIDNDKTDFTKKNYLFEGYMYDKTFLITDILAINSEIITCDYSLRYSLIYKIISQQDLKNLNGHLTINIHSIFQIQNDDNDNQINQLFNIFKNNFIFKNDIDFIEYINEKSLKKTQKDMCNLNFSVSIPILKRIYKTKYIDVYTVKNIETNDNENILYIKTIDDSKQMYKLLQDIDYLEIKCVYNKNFKKWQPIF